MSNTIDDIDGEKISIAENFKTYIKGIGIVYLIL